MEGMWSKWSPSGVQVGVWGSVKYSVNRRRTSAMVGTIPSEPYMVLQAMEAFKEISHLFPKTHHIFPSPSRVPALLLSLAGSTRLSMYCLCW